MRPRPGGDAELTGGGLHRPPRGYRSSAAVQSPAPLVGEDHAVGIIGIAGDAQMAEVVEPVMPTTQGQEIVGVGDPAVLPMDHVMDMEPAITVTSRHPTASVALLDDHPGAVGDGAEGPAHVHRPASGLHHRPDSGVTAHETAQAVAQGRAEVQVGAQVGPGGASRIGAHMQQDKVTVVVGPEGGAGAQGALGHGQEGIGPAHVSDGGRPPGDSLIQTGL